MKILKGISVLAVLTVFSSCKEPDYTDMMPDLPEIDEQTPVQPPVASKNYIVNGDLEDERDDLISDSQLYFLFVGLSAQVKQLNEPTEWDRIISQALADYEEPLPGAKERITKALQIMLTAWVAAQLRLQAEKMITELK